MLPVMQYLLLKLLSASCVEAPVSSVRCLWNAARERVARCLIRQFVDHRLHGCRHNSSQTDQYKLTAASSNLADIFPSPLTHILPTTGAGLTEIASKRALGRSSSFLKYLSAVYHSSHPAANAVCNSSETLQLFSLGSKSKDDKPKMTALNSLPHFFP